MALAIDNFDNASDGTGVTSLAVGGRLTGGNFAVTAGSILLIQVATSLAASLITVSSIFDNASLTWAKRASGSCLNGQFSNAHAGGELWWAYCASHQTSFVATIHLSGAPDVVVGSIIAVKGFSGTAYQTAPFDVNGALPNVQTSNTSTVPSAAITTTASNAMLIGACATGTNAVSSNGSGYTNDASGLFSFGNAFSDGVGSFIQQKVVSSPQVAVANNITPTTSNGWVMIGDALGQGVSQLHQVPSMGFG